MKDLCTDLQFEAMSDEQLREWDRALNDQYLALLASLDGLGLSEEALTALKQAVQAAHDIGWVVGKAKAEGKLQ